VHDPKQIVRDGYDAASERYRGDDGLSPYPYEMYLAELAPHLAPGDAVLDLGCGCGVPVARELARHHSVTGVDISPVQIERARRLVPAGEFHCADMVQVELPDAAYAAVFCCYALIHVPMAEHPGGHVLVLAERPTAPA
jgi:2-polyprenyl-3-methyl-5-hydroxy-6-metoxy-1,4-benzoquinol methylase